MDIDETFTQVRRRYQELQFQGWDQPTAESSTVHNNGKTGMFGVAERLPYPGLVSMATDARSLLPKLFCLFFFLQQPTFEDYELLPSVFIFEHM